MSQAVGLGLVAEKTMKKKRPPRSPPDHRAMVVEKKIERMPPSVNETQVNEQGNAKRESEQQQRWIEEVVEVTQSQSWSSRVVAVVVVVVVMQRVTVWMRGPLEWWEPQRLQEDAPREEPLPRESRTPRRPPAPQGMRLRRGVLSKRKRKRKKVRENSRALDELVSAHSMSAVPS